MKLSFVKAIILIAFIVLTAGLTYLGLNRSEAQIDFKALGQEQKAVLGKQQKTDFENLLKNIGSSTTVVKPDVLNSTDTARLGLSIQLLDTMKQYVYAGILSERLATLQNSGHRYHMAARYFLLETESHKNELMLFKKAETLLQKTLELNPNNLDAKVDLAVCTYNINDVEKPENMMELMKPAKLLLQVVAEDSNHVDGLYYLGKLALESNQTEKAIARFKKLVSLQPQNQAYYLELSQIYRKMGKETEAKAWEDKARAIK